MSFLRSYIRSRKQREKAKEEGRTSLVFGLMVLGGLFLAGHSLKSLFQRLSFRSSKIEGLGESGTEESKSISSVITQQLAKDAPQHALEDVGNAININNDRERE